MSNKKSDQTFSLLDLIKGGIPNPSGYPIPRAQQASKQKAAQKTSHRTSTKKND